MSKDPDEREPTQAEKLLAEAAGRAAVNAAASAVRSTVEGAATGALDAIERLLFGKVGGAEEAVRGDVDPLERIRAQYGAKEPVDPATKESE
jgi:hypothetical protein